MDILTKSEKFDQSYQNYIYDTHHPDNIELAWCL